MLLAAETEIVINGKRNGRGVARQIGVRHLFRIPTFYLIMR